MPGFAGVESESEARDAAVSLGLPCVVKPADETASFDVARCSTLSEVTAQFRLISGKAANIRGQRRFPKILVEEYARGFEVSVEVIAEGERVQVLGVTDKSVAGNGRFVEVGHVFPSLLPQAVVASCADLAVAALRAVGFDLGMAHVEIRVTEDGPKLIEINARPAGGGITDLVDAALSISCLELVIRQYLGERVLDRLAFDLFASRPRGAAVRFLTAAPGRVTSVGDLTPAERMPGVRKVKVSVSAGDTVNPLERNIDRLGYVFTVADHAYLAARQAESAASEVEILTSSDQRSELEAVA
jgi:biotin carboxylase